MKIYAPSYYKEFHCIADRCRHTCCAGWDVDIDEESLDKYKGMTGEFAEHLKKCIDFGDEPHFILTDDERCPLLNNNNLCELIIHEGEESLCQICRDHPRFRNYWTGRIEIGLGMACEEAARIILTQKEPMRLEIIEETVERAGAEDDNGGEGRDKLQNRCENAEHALKSSELPEDELYLMEVRERFLEDLVSEIFESQPSCKAAPLARLAEYLVYRHIADALYDDRLEERIAFVQDTFYMLAESWTDGRIETLAEIVRIWSNEYEYDTDKISDMLDKLAVSDYNDSGL